MDEHLDMIGMNTAMLPFLSSEAANSLSQSRIFDPISVVKNGANEEGLPEWEGRRERV
jgi:hypothetical protein